MLAYADVRVAQGYIEGSFGTSGQFRVRCQQPHGLTVTKSGKKGKGELTLLVVLVYSKKIQILLSFLALLVQNYKDCSVYLRY